MLAVLSAAVALVARPVPRLDANPMAQVRRLDAESKTCQWSMREEWALLDEAPSFTVGSGQNRVTFWGSLAAHNPILSQRTPSELQAHASILNLPVGDAPQVLQSAMSVSGGKTWTGTVDGHSRSINTASDGRLVSGASFIESLSGEIFEAELVTMSALQEPLLSRASEESWERSLSGTQDALDSEESPASSILSSLAKVWYPLYVSSMVAAVLLIGGQLLALSLHDAATVSTRVSWQQERVNEARTDVVQLERWLETRREAYSDDQDTFMRWMEELEPRLRASEMRLAELRLLQVD